MHDLSHLVRAFRSPDLLAAPALPCLGGTDVSVWLLSLVKCQPYLRECFDLLSSEERNRAYSFHHEARRSAYIAAHAMLRVKLSMLLREEVAPQAWSFQIGPHGKPQLAGVSYAFHFSLSYSGGIAAIAVSQAREIGIDLEVVPDIRPTPDIPWTVLAAAERAIVEGAPEKNRFEEFLKIWTLKEACSKCYGLDASRNFRNIQVSLDPPSVEMEPPPTVAGAIPILHQDTFEPDRLGFVLALVADARTTMERNVANAFSRKSIA